MERAKIFNKKIPRKIRGKYNFAYAQVNIGGINKTEYYAHSKIDIISEDYRQDPRIDIEDISLLPKEKIFKTQVLNTKNNSEISDGGKPWDRIVDSECKILHDVANQLQNQNNVSGTIKIYSQMECCPSCRDVIRQFNELYPDVKIEVIYEKEFY